MQAHASRRAALRWLILSGLAALGSGAVYKRVSEEGLLGHSEAGRIAEQLGALYIAQHPQDAELTILSQAVLSTDVAGLAALDPEAVRARALAAARADFQAGRVLELDGWCLSRSEARLCALTYLLSGTNPATGQG